MNFPSTFPILHDDYHAGRIGSLSDGTQFFVSTPFRSPQGEDPGAEYLVLYLFDANGTFREAVIDNFGPRATMDQELANFRLNERMAELTGATFGDIQIAPFSVEYDGTQFGFIPNPETGGIELQPGNYMAFFEPFDGYYDT